jgi:hypothetical protein
MPSTAVLSGPSVLAPDLSTSPNALSPDHAILLVFCSSFFGDDKPGIGLISDKLRGEGGITCPECGTPGLMSCLEAGDEDEGGAN